MGEVAAGSTLKIEMANETMKLICVLLLCLSGCVATDTFSNDEMIALLRDWKLDHAFEASIKAHGFDGYTLMGGCCPGVVVIIFRFFCHYFPFFV